MTWQGAASSASAMAASQLASCSRLVCRLHCSSALSVLASSCSMSCRARQVGCKFDVLLTCHHQTSHLRVLIQQERHQILRQDRAWHAGWILLQASFSNPAFEQGAVERTPDSRNCGETP